MRSTHFELLQAVLGEHSKYLIQYFENLKVMDFDISHPIDEDVFDRVFPAETCANLFGTPNLDRSTRAQRKMDLALLRQTYHLWRDRNYFDISPRLTGKLIDTELRDVDTFFIRAPYRSMYISLPKGNGLFIPNNISGLHEVEGIYLAFNDYGGPKGLLMPSKNLTLHGVTKHIQMLISGEPKGTFGDAIMFFDLIFFEGKVSESIERNKEILENPKLWDHIVEIFTFVTKVLLYINCANTAIQKIAGLDLEVRLNNIKSSAKKRKMIKKYCKISPEAHSLLDVIINHEQDTPGKSKDSSILLGPKALEKVRPHFKTQRYGSALSQSKIIWVESYLRGEGTKFYKDKHSFKVT
jgi:hypothetical protein